MAIKVYDPSARQKMVRLKVLMQHHRGGGKHVFPGQIIEVTEHDASVLINSYYAREALPEDVDKIDEPQESEVDRLRKENEELKKQIEKNKPKKDENK